MALGYLNKAVELDAEEELPLVVRSDCLTKYRVQPSRPRQCLSNVVSRLDQPGKALEDANKAIKINPDSARWFRLSSGVSFYPFNYRALACKAIALYNMGEFEKSLIQFERGWRWRPGSMMKTGLMQCKDAILNTVGPSAKPIDIEVLKKIENEKERKKIKNQKTLTDAKSTAKNERNDKVQDNIVLGKMGRDVTFLRDLLGPDTETRRASFSDEQVGIGGNLMKL